MSRSWSNSASAGDALDKNGEDGQEEDAVALGGVVGLHLPRRLQPQPADVSSYPLWWTRQPLRVLQKNTMISLSIVNIRFHNFVDLKRIVNGNESGGRCSTSMTRCTWALQRRAAQRAMLSKNALSPTNLDAGQHQHQLLEHRV